MDKDPTISINLKAYPETQLREEALNLYRQFSFEEGAGTKEDDSTILSEYVSMSLPERLKYIEQRVHAEHAAWNKNWYEQSAEYEKYMPEGDPELYYAALDRLMDDSYLQAIHNEVNGLNKTESPESKTDPIPFTIEQTQKRASDISPDLN